MHVHWWFFTSGRPLATGAGVSQLSAGSIGDGHRSAAGAATSVLVASSAGDGFSPFGGRGTLNLVTTTPGHGYTAARGSTAQELAVSQRLVAWMLLDVTYAPASTVLQIPDIAARIHAPGTFIFDQVSVDYAVRNTTHVTWRLRPRVRITDPEFQLQVLNGTGSWQDAGDAVYGWEAFDTVQRRCVGVDRWLKYRVRVLDDDTYYYSMLASTLGQLTTRQWGMYREIIRRTRVNLSSRSLRSLRGYLLKRQVDGAKCPECCDPYTGGVTNSDCDECHGTGYIPGYWTAGACTLIDIGTDQHQIRQEIARGTVAQTITAGRFVGLPEVHPEDVWISSSGDLRYRLGDIKHQSEFNQIPLIVDAELHLLPASDILYAYTSSGWSSCLQ